MLLTFKQFTGLVPRADPLMLPPMGAQVASNCRITAGVLEAFKAPSEVFTSGFGPFASIYRFGQTSNDATKFWFTATTPTSFVKGAIANDTQERTFYTDGVFPKQTDSTRATSSLPYPSGFQELGIDPPADKVTATVSNTAETNLANANLQLTANTANAATATALADLNTAKTELAALPADATQDQRNAKAQAVTDAQKAYDTALEASNKATKAAETGVNGTAVPEMRYYIQTYVDTSEFAESPPSLPSAPVQWKTGQEVKLELGAFPSKYVGILGFRRIYRTVTGSASTEYLLVAEIPIATTSYTDNVDASGLGDPCPTIDSSPPPDGGVNLIAMPNGMMAMNTQYDVYFCDAFKPYSWPDKYRQTVDYPIVGLGVFGTSLVVLTTGVPYIMTGSDPLSITVEKLAVPYSCMSAKSIASFQNSVVFAAPDGLVGIDGGGPRVLTDALMTRREWQAYDPANMTVAVWDEKIFMFGPTAGLCLDTQGVLTSIPYGAKATYVDPVTGSLYFSDPTLGKIYKWDAGAASTYTIKSRKHTLPFEVNLAAGQVLSDTYPVTVKVYADGVLKHTHSAVDSRPFRLPAGFRARYWELELSGSGRLLAAYLTDAVEELQGV